MDVLDEVVVEFVFEFDCFDDRGEVVVGEDHRCGFFGDFGVGDVYGDADVGLLECGCVVDAVVCYVDDVVFVFEDVDEVDFLFGCHVCDYVDFVDLLVCLLVAELGELGVGDCVVFDVEVLCDRCGGHGMVVGDHVDLDAGGVRCCDCCLCGWPWWVDDFD